jgi:hypothetical protein
MPRIGDCGRDRLGFQVGFDPTQLEAPTAVFTYAIVHASASAVKVGKSCGHPSARLAILQCGNPRPLQLLAWSLAIAEAHRRLRSWRLRGEWFMVTRPVLAYLDGHFDWLDLSLRASLRATAHAPL